MSNMRLHLDWSSYKDAGMGDAYADIPKTGGDYAKAIAVCINSRQCENSERGVMCPSYRISDQSNLSTGGRVKLLKAALNGELGPRPFDNPELEQTMDLCVGCKGCKRECENEVDMSRIKIEFLAQRHAAHGVPLRTRLFAGFPETLNKPWLKSLVSLRNRVPLLARLGEHLTGISAKRSLPEPQSGKPLHISGRGSRDVVLLADCLTRHFGRDIVQSAIEVLEAADCRVHLVGATPGHPLCCGRRYLAQGMVNEAKTEANRLLDTLEPHLKQGVPILGLEPSCLLSMRDDNMALGLDERAELLAGQALLFEEYLARELKAKRLNLSFNESDAGNILVHGHCHQKAVGAMKSMRKVLKMLPGLKFEFIESSCCGGAGSFALESEHSEHAQAMAEMSLLPTLRSAPEATVIANGFSCREQIRNGTSRQSFHLAQLLQQQLKGTTTG